MSGFIGKLRVTNNRLGCITGIGTPILRSIPLEQAWMLRISRILPYQQSPPVYFLTYILQQTITRSSVHHVCSAGFTVTRSLADRFYLNAIVVIEIMNQEPRKSNII